MYHTAVTIEQSDTARRYPSRKAFLIGATLFALEGCGFEKDIQTETLTQKITEWEKKSLSLYHSLDLPSIERTYTMDTSNSSTTKISHKESESEIILKINKDGVTYFEIKGTYENMERQCSFTKTANGWKILDSEYPEEQSKWKTDSYFTYGNYTRLKQHKYNKLVRMVDNIIKQFA